MVAEGKELPDDLLRKAWLAGMKARHAEAVRLEIEKPDAVAPTMTVPQMEGMRAAARVILEWARRTPFKP